VHPVTTNLRRCTAQCVRGTRKSLAKPQLKRITRITHILRQTNIGCLQFHSHQNSINTMDICTYAPLYLRTPWRYINVVLLLLLLCKCHTASEFIITQTMLKRQRVTLNHETIQINVKMYKVHEYS